MNDNLDNNQVNNEQVQEKDISDKVIESVDNIINTTDHISDYDKEDIKNHKTDAILSYIPFVPFYFVFTGKHKESKYLTFHANQGMLVTIVLIISIIVSILLKALFKRDSMIINDVPGIISFISYLMYSISIILMLFGMINTSNDSSKELPLIGKITILK